MGIDSDRRTALGEFLRQRRAQLDRTRYGLPPVRGRVRGLRREEIAHLSGVSMTWYTWLEQGRSINPSLQVMDALSRVFDLDESERRYILSLAGYTVPRRGEPRAMPQSVQNLIDRLGGCPSYAIEYDWTIVGWNSAYERLFPAISRVAPEDRNLIALIFTEPAVRDLLPDWPETSRRFLAQFRADVGPRLDDPRVTELVAQLRERSPEFAAGWSKHDVALFNSRERVFRPPGRPTVRVEHHTVVPVDHPDLQIVIYTPLDGTPQVGLWNDRRGGSLVVEQ